MSDDNFCEMDNKTIKIARRNIENENDAILITKAKHGLLSTQFEEAFCFKTGFETGYWEKVMIL